MNPKLMITTGVLLSLCTVSSARGAEEFTPRSDGLRLPTGSIKRKSEAHKRGTSAPAPTAGSHR